MESLKVYLHNQRQREYGTVQYGKCEWSGVASASKSDEALAVTGGSWTLQSVEC
jgi:hypothetical protein